jgi:hypothetical protein
MKLTKSQLKKIIKEELSNLSEGNAPEKLCQDYPDLDGCEDYRAEMKAQEKEYQEINEADFSGLLDPGVHQTLTAAAQKLALEAGLPAAALSAALIAAYEAVAKLKGPKKLD